MSARHNIYNGAKSWRETESLANIRSWRRTLSRGPTTCTILLSQPPTCNAHLETLPVPDIAIIVYFTVKQDITSWGKLGGMLLCAFVSDCVSHVGVEIRVASRPFTCPWEERIRNVLLSHDDRAGRPKRVLPWGLNYGTVCKCGPTKE